MRHCYALLLLLLLAAPFLVQAQNPEPLFPQLERVLYQDAAHAYDDPTVIMLSKRRTSLLQSRLIPVRQGETVSFETHVHYTRSKTKTWQKVGAAAAGLAIGSLPYVLNRDAEGRSDNDWLKTAAPLAGAGVAALPLILDQRKGKPISRSVSAPRVKNGLFVPNAYLRYKLYDAKGYLLKTETQSIDKQAKDAWQRLALQEEIAQDGYMMIELGNDSQRPVWMDGLQIEQSSGLNTRVADDSVSNPRPGIDFPVNEQCVTDCDDDGNEGDDSEHDGDTGGDVAYSIVLADVVVITASPITGNPNYGSSLIGYSGGNPMYYYNPLQDSRRSSNGSGGSGGVNGTPLVNDDGTTNVPSEYGEGNYLAVRNPGKKDWSGMSDTERAEHFLKAIQYVFAKEGASGVVNLNNFFSNIPLTNGDLTGGTHHVININLTVNGKSFPMQVRIPVNQDIRVFRADYVKGPTYVSHGGFANGPQMNFYFDETIGGTIVGPEIYVPYGYEDEVEQFLYGK